MEENKELQHKRECKKIAMQCAVEINKGVKPLYMIDTSTIPHLSQQEIIDKWRDGQHTGDNRGNIVIENSPYRTLVHSDDIILASANRFYNWMISMDI